MRTHPREVPVEERHDRFCELVGSNWKGYVSHENTMIPMFLSVSNVLVDDEYLSSSVLFSQFVVPISDDQFRLGRRICSIYDAEAKPLGAVFTKHAITCCICAAMDEQTHVRGLLSKCRDDFLHVRTICW